MKENIRIREAIRAAYGASEDTDLVAIQCGENVWIHVWVDHDGIWHVEPGCEWKGIPDDWIDFSGDVQRAREIIHRLRLTWGVWNGREQLPVPWAVSPVSRILHDLPLSSLTLEGCFGQAGDRRVTLHRVSTAERVDLVVGDPTMAPWGPRQSQIEIHVGQHLNPQSYCFGYQIVRATGRRGPARNSVELVIQDMDVGSQAAVVMIFSPHSSTDGTPHA